MKMDYSMSTLLCLENEMCFDGDVVDEEYSFIPLQKQNYGGFSDDEYMAILIEREISFGFKKNDESLVFENWIKRDRNDAINWILKTKATLGFHVQTAYLSVSYLDRFLSKRSIDSNKCWAIRLLSVACLSLAAKMEESYVPLLSEFQLEDYCFESKLIQRMELAVLSTLEWNMAVVTPFAFLPYFITKLFKDPPPSYFLSKTMQLIFILMNEVNLMDHRPSVIAAAATLVAMDQELTIEALELKMSSIHQSIFVDPKDIFSCYNLIQTLSKDRDKLIDSSSSSPIQSRPIGMAESFLVTSVTKTKRRRLTFNNDKESCEGKKLH